MYFVTVKKVIDEWDPIDLLAMHCPPDEYDHGTRKILVRIVNNNVDEIAKVISDVFTEAFGSDIFTKNIDECREIAMKIIYIHKSKVN